MQSHLTPRLPWLATLTLGVLLASCSTPPPPPPPPPVVAGPPLKPAPIDGTYDGIRSVIRGGNVSCGTQDPITLHVANHAFHYVLNQPGIPWQPTRVFDVTIAPDGSFQTQAGTAYMRGLVGGGHMQGEISGDACAYAFEADSSGSW
jgi:hypothetical protein